MSKHKHFWQTLPLQQSATPACSHHRRRWIGIGRASLLSGFISAVIAGCTVGPDYHPPHLQVPDYFTRYPTTLPTTQASHAAVDLQHWWEALDDPELNSLEARAVHSNLDLQQAVARLQQARENEAIFTGTSLPELEFSGAAGRGTGTNDTKGRIASPLNAGSNTTGYKEITHLVGFDAAWEIDLFGHLRRQAQAVIADTAAAAEVRNNTLIVLLADVARNYTLARSLQMRIGIALDSIKAQDRSAQFARFKYKQGLTNQLDVELAERELLTTQAALQPLQAQLLATERNLSVLLAQPPDSLRAELDKTSPLPQPPAEFASGLPGDLLRRRPDIRQAEAELMAANARIGVAVSQLYPQIMLTGGIGAEGQGLGRLPVKWSLDDSIGPSVHFPLLDFGTLDAQVQFQSLQTEVALAQYRKIVLQAIAEVDDSLTNYDAQRARRDQLKAAVSHARKAVDIANERYNRGLTDFLYVLDAEQALYVLQDQFAVADNETVTQFIAVCKSLGGGWEQYQTPPPPGPRPAVIAVGADILGERHGPVSTAQPPGQ